MNQHHKNQCMTSHFSQPRYLPTSSPSPPRCTPTPVPTTKTVILITVCVICFPWCFFFFSLLYCSPYIVVMDWFVSYAFTSVGKRCTVTYPPNKSLNLKNWTLKVWRVRFWYWICIIDVLGWVALHKRNWIWAVLGKKINANYSIFIVWNWKNLLDQL